MLNQDTMSDLTSGINPHQLDATIRDSIRITRELGFRFPWIDALCIPQDNSEFKAKELGGMGSIYRNTTFTIVASAAKDVKAGFLTRRVTTIDSVAPADGQLHRVFKVDSELMNTKMPIETLPVILSPWTADTVEPWDGRAWTLQELLFSRRRLQYHAKQTTWVCCCSEIAVHECDGWTRNTDRTGFNSKLWNDIIALLRNSHHPPHASTILSYWYELVLHHSHRESTYLTDRLPAISAIAKEFASIWGGQYVCGLWMYDLALGLLWSNTKAILWSTAEEPLSRASDQKLRTSWSWASTRQSLCWYSDIWTLLQNEDFEILACKVGLRTSNETFGEVERAELHVCGLLKPIPCLQGIVWYISKWALT